MRKELTLGLLVGSLVLAPSLLAQAPKSIPGAAAFADLVGALKASPGCAGVETARTTSGKQVIFAWFENKKAALDWYYSDTHIGLMTLTGSSPDTHPMADVPDDGSPILAVASVTLATPLPDSPSGSFGISQIAIELYKPLPGGIAVGGRFAPPALKIPGLRDLPMTGESHRN